jgi:isoleucyl-tRNA synthetase
MKKSISKAPSRVNFYELEQNILKFWKEQEILEKSLEKNKNNEIKSFYDGPLTANGMPHHGHMLTFAIKDAFPRYWSMQGYYVQRSLGWDCQGIPVEYEIEKKLEFKQKSDIENYGIAKFNKLCRDSVLEYRSAMIELEEKMGRMTTNAEEYATMDANYIESIWWSLAEIYKKGLLYEGFKVVPYSTRAGTSLSNAEVALGGYKKVVDKAVTIEFKLLNEENTFVLAWTTTPWTLPTNFALAVGKDIEYVKVTAKKEGKMEGNFYIVAKELAQNIFGENYKIVDTFLGSSLVGKKYEPLFDYFLGRKNCFQIYEGFHVTSENGTGIVHLAPYGAEDCEIFHNVGIEPIDVLDSQGDYTSNIPDLKGIFYKAVNKIIIERLEQNDSLFEVKDYEHDMPMCWRTNTPLIYKPITSWYIAMSKLRNELLANNDQVNWIPKHIKNGRFGNWLSEIKDWGISRLRYWGTPIPIWKSESGKFIVIESYKQLEELSGVQITDPHKPFIDDVKFTFEGEEYTRIPDVLDVWYDSGAMPFARYHYPFENKELFEKKFPAEFIAEGVDQTRGWFYSLMAISTAVFGKTPYKNVIVNGFTLDDKGIKVSKSKKNYDAPDKLFEEFGADTIRFNYFSTPIVAGEDSTITAKTLKLITQEFTLPLWNLFVYLTTYCELFNFEADINLYTENYFASLTNPLDIWAITRVKQATNTVIEELDKFGLQKANFAIKDLMSDISTWYIRRNRERFANGDKTAIEVLYYLVLELIKLLAPVAPFLSEEIYQNIVVKTGQNAPISIHLCDFPVSKSFEERVISDMQIIRDICSIGLKARATSGVKLRQPLSKAMVKFEKSENFNLDLLEIVKQELNVKEIEFVEKIEQTENLIIIAENNFVLALDKNLTKELEEEGYYREVSRQIQSARKNAGLNFGELVDLCFKTESEKLKLFIEANRQSLASDLYLKSIENKEEMEFEIELQVVKIEKEEITFKFI